MSVAVIELNDSEVVVTRSGAVVASSPGIAVLREDRIELGAAAAQSSHTDPRNTFSRFWSDLSQDSLKRRTKLARHHADLAYAHLRSLHELASDVEQVVFAVPGSFTTQQLSLLLGLAQASPFTPVGLVDSAVAAAAAQTGAGSYNHLDIHLHHTVVTVLEVSDTVQRGAVSVVDNAGLLELRDQCVNHIADLFVRQSRFDPLHHPATERALCDSLTRCLRELREQTDTLVELGFEHARYQARVNRERLVQALQPLYSRIIAAAEPARVALLHPRLAGLPMFIELLTAAGNRIEVLDERALYKGCMNYVSGRLPGAEEVYFVTQLESAAKSVKPVAGATAELAEVTAPEQPTPEQKPEPSPHATHVLVHDAAHALGAAPLYLSEHGVLESGSRALEARCSLSLTGAVATLLPVNAGADLCVNGQPVNGSARVRPGDRISLAGLEHPFILLRVLA